jgi:hypothetical protein
MGFTNSHKILAINDTTASSKSVNLSNAAAGIYLSKIVKVAKIQ